MKISKPRRKNKNKIVKYVSANPRKKDKEKKRHSSMLPRHT